MERVRKSLKGRSWRKVITCFLACCLLLNTSLSVAPADEVPGMIEGEVVVQGTAGFNTVGDITTVTTGGPSTIIEYSLFNINAGSTVNFNQPGLSSAVLNRVIEANQSLINGNLISNGRVFLVNPAGVLFGSGSTVNVTQLVASGLNMSNDAFNNYIADPVNNQMEFVTGDGDVVNRATITADSVYLIGKKVHNIYLIKAPDGLVVMAAGDEVRLFQDGSNVSVVVSDFGDGFPDVYNSSNINVGNGKIVLAAGDTFSRAIRNTAILSAQGGTVTANAAIVENRGRIDVSVSPPSADGDGGSISLTGTEQVIIGESHTGVTGRLFANAGVNGNGGDITIQTEGKLTIEENTVITANGGSGSGNGGSVTITCDDFEIAGEIDASFGNKMSGGEISEPGKLEITSSSAIIADGANAGAENTIYEDDIEALSQAGTSLIVNAQEGITVKDITDGEITGQFGSIELHATGDDSAVTFADNTNTIRTTLGDIVIEAGSGGIDVGNLTTGKDLPGEKPAPGKIFLTTGNGGDITTGNLTVRDGWGDGEVDAEIDVKSSGNLTVNGDVMVGSVTSPILNVADERPAEAKVILRADNDLTLDGSVGAYANGSEEDTSITKATIDIIAGNNATITGNLSAEATSSSSGTADAVIKVEAVGDIDFPGEAHAIANDAAADSTGPDHQDDEETSPDGHAQVIIDDSAIFLVDDNFSTPKSAADIVLDVLANDTLEGEATIDSYDIDPADGSLTQTEVDEKTVLIYNPPEDLSTLTFNENGEATVTFTYTVEGRTATGTVTLINGLPVAIDDLAATTLGKSVNIDVLKNDTDPDLGDVLTAIDFPTTTKNGTLVLNEDGTFTYTPNEGFVGDDSFKYSATDSFNKSSEVEVKITVTEKPIITAPSYIPPAPGLERIEIEISGCPALVKWAAEEVGIDQRLVQVWVANSLASTGNIQPCDACEGLKNAAKILQDADGTHIAALAQVINEFASSTAPPTEEQMASIADAITRNTDAESYYAIADEYLDALATYVGILSSEMGFSTIESVQLITDKYVGRLAQDQNVGVATFIAASLAALGG